MILFFSFLITLEILSTDTKRVVVVVRGERLSALLDHPKQCRDSSRYYVYISLPILLFLLSLLMRYLRAVIFFSSCLFNRIG
jgi:hypothetical protein